MGNEKESKHPLLLFWLAARHYLDGMRNVARHTVKCAIERKSELGKVVGG